MRHLACLVICLASLTAPLFIAQRAEADGIGLCQEVDVSFVGPRGEFFDNDNNFPTSTDFRCSSADRYFYAAVGGEDGGHFVEALISPFGNVGIRGGSSSPGEARASVGISNGFFYDDLFGAPATVTTNFIIDGGFLRLGTVGTREGDFVEFNLRLGSTLNPPDPWQFETFLRITRTDSGHVYSFEGDDINAFVDTSAFFPTIRIPLSFQSVDLGTVRSGEDFGISYEAVMRASTSVDRVLATRFGFAFGDPGTVDVCCARPTVSFAPVAAQPIPEPATLLLLGSGLLGLAGYGRKNRRR